MHINSVFIAASLVSSFAIGCGGSSPNQNNLFAPMSHYTLIVNPAFTSDEINDITLSAQAWEKAVPVSFDIQIGETNGVCPKEGTICVSIGTNNQHYSLNDAGLEVPDDAGIYSVAAWTNWCFKDAEAEISMDTRASNTGDAQYQLIAAHEMGHAMGLHHQGDPNVLMFPVQNGNVSGPVAADIKQWKSLRGE